MLWRKRRNREYWCWILFVFRVFGEGFIDKVTFELQSKESEGVSREGIWENFPGSGPEHA